MILATPLVRLDFSLVLTVGHACNLFSAKIRQLQTLGSLRDT